MILSQHWKPKTLHLAPKVTNGKGLLKLKVFKHKISCLPISRCRKIVLVDDSNFNLFYTFIMTQRCTLRIRKFATKE